MKTFQEWLAQNHPEMLDEAILQKLAELPGVKNMVAGAGLFLGSMGIIGGGDASAAISAVPGVSQGEHSDTPFDRKFLLELAPQMRPGVSIEKLEKMSDWDLWYWQQERVTSLEQDMARHTMAARRGAMSAMKSWPKWYLKFGSHYGWKPVSPPSTK